MKTDIIHSYLDSLKYFNIPLKKFFESDEHYNTEIDFIIKKMNELYMRKKEEFPIYIELDENINEFYTFIYVKLYKLKFCVTPIRNEKLKYRLSIPTHDHKIIPHRNSDD